MRISDWSSDVCSSDLRLSAFLEGQGLEPRHVALDPEGVLGVLTGAPALPTTLFIAADGTVRQTHVGEISRVQLDIAIRALSRAEEALRPARRLKRAAVGSSPSAAARRTALRHDRKSTRLNSSHSCASRIHS